MDLHYILRHSDMGTLSMGPVTMKIHYNEHRLCNNENVLFY